MQSSPTNYSAIIRGEQRSTRYKYRHTVFGAANELGIPASWIWFWLVEKRLKFRTWLRCLWVRVDRVRELLADIYEVRAAYFGTREKLTCPETISRARELWPDGGDYPFIDFPAKVISMPARRETPALDANPVLCEEAA